MSSTALQWFKSSYSGSDGGSDGGNCVEAARDAAAIHIRDSKTPTTPHLTVTPEAWTTFLDLAR
ncbi:DUF397 domain-containing protein [Streptomyces sp. JW3]|uniref:DUF397 domain-containing protein n=1 Tax=Streptomyces sp. JW3 TaxID=3456955 RepID=UPI003FA4BFEB